MAIEAMADRKPEVYAILSGVLYNGSPVVVYESRPEVIADFPSMSYYIGDDVPVRSIRGELGIQHTEVIVDIWGATSEQTGAIKVALEQAMQEAGFKLVFSNDIDDPSPEKISHVTTRFNF